MSIARRSFLKALFIGASVAFARPKMALAGDVVICYDGPEPAGARLADALSRRTGRNVYVITTGQSTMLDLHCWGESDGAGCAAEDMKAALVKYSRSRLVYSEKPIGYTPPLTIRHPVLLSVGG